VGKKLLIVVDMQKDFVDGALGTKEAQAMLPALEKKLASFDGEVIFTQDTIKKIICKLKKARAYRCHIVLLVRRGGSWCRLCKNGPWHTIAKFLKSPPSVA